MKKTTKKDKEVMNGNMINNEKELEIHSKTMEQISTNKEVKKKNKVPDPKQ